MPQVSIVVPLYNEEDNVPLLHAAVTEVLAAEHLDYELVLVDDGSSDRSFARAEALVAQDARVRVVKFRRNYGQTAAMAAGIRVARGEVIVTMDGDLQNDPTDIPRLLALLGDGYDIALGWRRKRQDDGARVFVSKVANRIIARIMGVAVRDSGCSLKAFRADLIQSLPMYGEMHRFIPALSQLAGARMAQIEVKHHPRRFGVSKYGFSRIYKVILDIVSIRVLLSYARHPVAWHGGLTAIALALALIFFAAAALQTVHGSLTYASIGVLFTSLAIFLLAWGLVAQLLAALHPGVARFASLATSLSSRRAELERRILLQGCPP